MIKYVPSLRAEGWNKLLEQGPDNDDLLYIIRNVEPLRLEAGQKLLEQNPDNDNLTSIIKYVEPLREVAQEMLDKIERRESLLEEILNA